MTYETPSYFVDYDQEPPVYTCKKCSEQYTAFEGLYKHLQHHKNGEKQQTIGGTNGINNEPTD